MAVDAALLKDMSAWLWELLYKLGTLLVEESLFLPGEGPGRLWLWLWLCLLLR